MKVVLLKDVPKLGKKYEVKDVSDGYGRNYLIRLGFAELATAVSLKKVDEFKQKSLDAKRMEESEIEALLNKISDVKLLLKEKANDEGILFAGIKIDDITKTLKNQAGLDVFAEYIKLDKPVKAVGEYQIEVSTPTSKKSVKFKLIIEKE